MLVFEDLHWADEGLLDFIEHLAERCRDSPLLLLCTTRPELHERRAWGARANSANIALGTAFERRDGEAGGLSADAANVAEGVERELSSAAPKGTRCMPRSTSACSLIAGCSSATTACGGFAEETLPLPENVGGILAARLDALPAPEKAVIHDASVIGRSFWPGAITAVGQEDAHFPLIRP